MQAPATMPNGVHFCDSSFLSLSNTKAQTRDRVRHIFYLSGVCASTGEMSQVINQPEPEPDLLVEASCHLLWRQMWVVCLLEVEAAEHCHRRKSLLSRTWRMGHYVGPCWLSRSPLEHP